MSMCFNNLRLCTIPGSSHYHTCLLHLMPLTCMRDIYSLCYIGGFGRVPLPSSRIWLLFHILHAVIKVPCVTWAIHLHMHLCFFCCWQKYDSVPQRSPSHMFISVCFVFVRRAWRYLEMQVRIGPWSDCHHKSDDAKLHVDFKMGPFKMSFRVLLSDLALILNVFTYVT